MIVHKNDLKKYIIIDKTFSYVFYSLETCSYTDSSNIGMQWFPPIKK